MTVLVSKAARDSIGIDTFERGFLYATLLLIASNTSLNNTKPGRENPYYTAIEFNLTPGSLNVITNDDGSQSKTKIIDPTITTKAHLPYDKGFCLKAGGNFFEYIGDFGNIDPNPLLITLQATRPRGLLIPNEPSWVNNLERYMLWTAMNLNYGYTVAEVIENPIEILPVEDSAGKTFMQISATLPYMEETFLKKRNLLDAIRSVIEKAIPSQ